MRRSLYISLLTLMVALFFGVSAMPHHHHRGVFCLEVEYCAEDDLPNDHHTGHSDDRSECPDHTLGLTVRGETLHLHVWSAPVPLAGLLGEYRLTPLIYAVRHLYPERAIPCDTLTLARPHGRRGPPSLL